MPVTHKSEDLSSLVRFLPTTFDSNISTHNFLTLMISSSNSRQGRSSSQSERAKIREAAVQVKCKFCGNTFMAAPHLAVCVKCGRPANKPLETLWIAIAFFLPIIGLFYALSIRSFSPRAAQQGIKISMLGLVIYASIYAVLRFVMHVV